MTWEELLISISAGKFPMVEYMGEIGVVTSIKDQRINGKNGYLGCTVNFGKNYDDWFWAEPGNDRRSKYMRDLKLLEDKQ